VNTQLQRKVETIRIFSVADLCKDHSGVASSCDKAGNESVGAPCETRPCHQGKKRVVSCAHHDEPYKFFGKLVKPKKHELVYKPRFTKRTRQRFFLFFYSEVLEGWSCKGNS
jgi:hypothetical protein